MLRSKSGFTLIELLIVIVVIAILAAITVVAYNGIQDRAEASRASAAVESYVKLLRMYKVDHGDYPSTASELYGEACLGKPSDFPAESNIGAGLCLQGQGSNTFTIKVSQTINDQLAEYGIASNTELRAYKVVTEIWRGIRYDYDPSMTQALPTIEWAVKPGQSCAPARDSSWGDCEAALCDVRNPPAGWCPTYGI